jgi:hypothetical protein
MTPFGYLSLFLLFLVKSDAAVVEPGKYSQWREMVEFKVDDEWMPECGPKCSERCG